MCNVLYHKSNRSVSLQRLLALLPDLLICFCSQCTARLVYWSGHAGATTITGNTARQLIQPVLSSFLGHVTKQHHYDEAGNFHVLTMQKLEVHVLEGPEAEVKTVTVLIDVTQKQAKAYRGGYKDKRKGTLYHNADCQTDRQVRMHSMSCAQRGLTMVRVPVDWFVLQAHPAGR